jgi:two-component system NarL family sensor kinase
VRADFGGVFIPLLPWLLVLAALVATTAHAYLTLGLPAVIGFGAVLVIAQLLLNALMRGRARAQRLSAERDRLLSEALEAETRERRRMAAELHDDALQTLLVARQDAHEAAEGHPGRLARIEAGLDDAVEKLRRTMSALEPDRDGEAVDRRLTRLTRLAQWSPGLSCEVAVDPEARGVADPVVSAVAQELFTNVVKHARATTVRVSLSRSNGSLVLVVADDGVGIDPAALETAAGRGHIGIQLVRQRVASREGTVELGGGPGEGTSVRVVVPMAAKA